MNKPQLSPAKPVWNRAPFLGDEEIVRQSHVALPVAVVLGLTHYTAFHNQNARRHPAAAERHVRFEANVVRLGVRSGRKLDQNPNGLQAIPLDPELRRIEI